ncbi:hypothetical protein PPYR_11337 [Photinus pyralis]|uniref:Uncharacterized protein n=1 Tax=Photinus pyralis TaxID=7054 RepID=A0A1Y1KB36_PHOPY|nr:GATOR complex protein MIOS-B isoform X2 [Photinus pyralis]KAB0794498.1 hypothetical protein PPYR_11337 [Photinus pyralis]
MSSKLEIQWTPAANKFITWGSELNLYETVSLRDGCIPTVKLSNTIGANLLATNSTHHYVKCIDIYPKCESDLLLAIGQVNGRVTLLTFGPSQFDSLSLPGKEFVPRHPRQCNVVAWNPIEGNLIAAGLDKYRSDHSLLLWDIMKCPTVSDMNGSGKLVVNTMAPGLELAKPVAEFGVSEMTHSLAWFNSNSKCVAVGMNLKNIKLIDFRDSSKAVNSTLTKAVYGLCIDPHNDKHLASFIDNQVCVWDTRNFEKPIVTLPHSKSVIKIGWSPTRHNLLTSLQRDSSVITLYDIQHTFVGTEEVEPSVLERVIVPGSPHNITSFSWHHSYENRLLTIALSGSVNDFTVCDRITLNWAPNSNMVWTFGSKTMKCINDDTSLYGTLCDISHKIKQRAIDGYGLKDDFLKNGELIDDVMVSKCWNWLQISSQLVEEGILRGYNSKHPGVRAVLKMDGTINKSELISMAWTDLGNVNCYSSAKIYKHEDRDKALHLCGWYFERDVSSLSLFLERLQKEQAYSRAAAISVFNLKIKMALDILNQGSENGLPNLNVVAMALAGFSDDKTSMWRQLCSATRAQLTDPYLRAMFAFLTAENYSYENVLNEDGMLVCDRIAFACTFLSDSKLHDYLRNLTSQLIDDGNLDGILLTGNSNDGIRLLQKYLDTTGDIQSTTIIGVKAFSNDMFGNAVKEWVSSYRNLLDTWQLWNERALFDIMLSSYRPTDKPPQQVYISCNFCGKSISAFMQGLNRGRGTFSRMGGTPNKLKMSSCPNCRKPLPRCAICLMHMGTTTGLHNSDDGDNRLAEFSHWFTWCQTCRHGGHASHMIHWFKEHSECPVTPCTCRCFSVDSLSNEIST